VLMSAAFIAGCQPAGGAGASDSGTMLATAMDTIQFGRNVVITTDAPIATAAVNWPRQSGSMACATRSSTVRFPSQGFRRPRNLPGQRDGPRQVQRAPDLQRHSLWPATWRDARRGDHVHDAWAGQLPDVAQVPRSSHAVARVPAHVRPGDLGDRGVPQARREAVE
jgi:hypothetical protein